MRVKRFIASTMREAIAQVKTDFGSGAVILHTRRVRSRGLLGVFRRPRVEIVAAAENPASSGAPVRDQSDAQSMAPESLVLLRAHLVRQDIADDFIDDLLPLANPTGEGFSTSDPSGKNAKEYVRHSLARAIRCCDPDEGLGQAKVHFVVGPTGVGKTTTIAKLAANYALLAKRRVALVTNDTYRIAAVEQLKVYAEIIGVPLDVVMTPGELIQAIERRSDSDMIFVDTAGRSHHHQLQMHELRQLVTATKDSAAHLVLSASTRWHDLSEILGKFNVLPLSSIIITKIDETSTYGTLYNVCRMSGYPLSFLTNGQSVPDDIEIATTRKIVDLIIGDVRGYS